jgi:L-ascorbate oxidase
MIAKPAVISQFSAYQPTGWVYDICLRPSDGSNQCPQTAASDNLYGGTRLQVSPGDVLKIHLVNKLPPTDYESGDNGDAFLGLNPTNLHLHGMLVSPRYATASDATWGDNVFLYNFNSANGVPALGSNLHGTAQSDVVDYKIQIPEDHPSGLYWFHPHIHGISERQIAAGLAGIVTVGQVSDYVCVGISCDEAQGTATARHLILKDMQVLKNGMLLPHVDSGFCREAPDAPGQAGCAGLKAPYPTPMDYTGGRWFFTINGQQNPTLTVGSANGQLWRIVNTSASTTYRLNLWDPASQRQMLMRVISIDGVSINVGADTDPAALITQAGNRFAPLTCPGNGGLAAEGVCATYLHLMPSSRAEVWVTYRGLDGVVQAPPVGASLVLRSSGYAAGPGGDVWPAIDLAKVAFAPGDGPAEPVTVTSQVARLTNPQRISAALSRANADVPVDTSCMPLAAGHKRRIFFGGTNTVPYSFGLGYEEIDTQGQSVPGTFVDISAFDPTQPTVCVPLAADNAAVTEQWELVNLQASDHNFHMHQAHFSVLSQASVAATAVPDQLSGVPLMMDSLPLIHADGDCATVADWRRGACTAHPATIEIHFAIAGDFVYHCHILAHEDAGMMAVIRVRSAAATANASLMDRMLSTLRLADAAPKQPLAPRIGGLMCRGPRR